MTRQKPIISISFHDLESIGYKISYIEDSLNILNEDGDQEEIYFAEEILMTEDGKELSKEDLDKVLYFLGLDTKQFNYYVDYRCNHVTRLCGNKEGYRFSCEERLDRPWIISGNASDYAYLASSKMRDMLDEVTRHHG